jgi:hypothetical protein
VVEVYGHLRDQDGRLKEPPRSAGAGWQGPGGYQGALMQLDLLCSVFNVPPEMRRKKEAELKVQYGEA